MMLLNHIYKITDKQTNKFFQGYIKRDKVLPIMWHKGTGGESRNTAFLSLLTLALDGGG